MLKKIIFILVGVAAAIGLSSYVRAQTDDTPVKAQKAVEWEKVNQSSVVPNLLVGQANELTWKTLSDVTFKQYHDIHTRIATSAVAADLNL